MEAPHPPGATEVTGRPQEPSAPGRFAVRLSLAAPAPRTLVVPDAREVVRDFFQHQTDGWLFEAAVRDPVNLAHPHHITLANWTNLRLLTGDLISTADAALLDDPTVSEALEKLPPEADFFESGPGVRSDALAVAEHLVSAGGLTPLVATGLLYQKRPALFPMVDRSLRLVLGLPVGPSSRQRILTESFEQLASLGRAPENQQALGRTLEWLGTHPSITRYLSLTPIRLVGLLAASAAEALQPAPDRVGNRSQRRANAEG